MHPKSHRPARAGFTLIELLIVLAILAVLLGLAWTYVGGDRGSDVATYMKALHPGQQYTVFCRPLGATRRCDVKLADGGTVALSCQVVGACRPAASCRASDA